MIVIIIYYMLHFDQTKNVNLVSELTVPEKIIIWGAREWLNLIRVAKDPRQSLINGFSQILVQEAVLHFDKLMRTIAFGALKTIDIRTQCCLEIGEGERNILACITFSQINFKSHNKRLLSSFIEKNLIETTSKNIDEIAKSFTRMGYFFPLKNHYLNLVGEDLDDFKNVVFNRFNKNDFMKYF